MSDEELEALRRRRLQKLRRRLEGETKTAPEKEQGKALSEQRQTESTEEILNRFFTGRAWEVLNAAKAQYPEAGTHVENTLVKLIREGKIRSRISGQELYGLFRRIGYRVRLQTRIQVLEHGKVKSLEEKIKEETSE
ncbi:MAG: hypothetical protein OEZ24_05195 [Candidatus Bathyarchaeota archaeon]|nr:hypothetical protein [Candidatus Bathyarchaeota archaeon]